jgi:hypothetical protein
MHATDKALLALERELDALAQEIMDRRQQVARNLEFA